MPCDYSKYSSDWPQIRARILQRAADRCETCGVANHAVIFRSTGLGFWYDPAEDDYFRYPSGKRVPGRFETELKEKPTRIVLTISHTDHDIGNNADSNLLALCQMCHIRHDAKEHAANAAVTRRRKHEQANPPLLCLD